MSKFKRGPNDGQVSVDTVCLNCSKVYGDHTPGSLDCDTTGCDLPDDWPDKSSANAIHDAATSIDPTHKVAIAAWGDADGIVRPAPDQTSALDIQEGGNHYKDMVIQPVEFIHRNNIGFIEGSVIKYVSRWKNKNGLQDLRKARHFLDILIEEESRSLEPK